MPIIRDDVERKPIINSPFGFDKLRHDKDFHLGLGDIRLTLGMQEEIEDKYKRLQQELDTWKKAYARAENESRCFQEEYEKMHHRYMVLKNKEDK